MGFVALHSSDDFLSATIARYEYIHISFELVYNISYITHGAGTTDVAREFDIQQPSAYRRLKALENDGRVSSRRIGGSLFWKADEDPEDGT